MKIRSKKGKERVIIMGRNRRRRSRVIREGKLSFVKGNMAGDDEASSSCVEATKTFLRGGVAEKYARESTRGKLVRGCACDIGIATATEHVKVIVARWRAKEGLVRSEIMKGGGRKKVNEVSGDS